MLCMHRKRSNHNRTHTKLQGSSNQHEIEPVVSEEQNSDQQDKESSNSLKNFNEYININGDEIPIVNNESVTDKFFHFYEKFNQWTTDIFPDLKSLEVEPEQLPKAVRYIIEHCISTQQSNNDLKQICKLFINFEKETNVEALNQSFPSSHKFISYINDLKKWKVRRQNYKLLNMDTACGLNSSAIFDALWSF